MNPYLVKTMRYFIYYPPTKSLKRVDVKDDTLVQEIIDMVRQQFGIRVDLAKGSNMSVVLNYNGSDLKSTWSLNELGIPSGAILYCLSRDRKTIDLQVHCEFNQQTLDFFFDNTLNVDTTVGDLRKRISDQLGLPLSTFCLEIDQRKGRLYDNMKLYQYEIKSNDHIHLKVWRGYESFLNSCMKGFPKSYARDDLTRHYQLQIALYVAAFYGHMELGKSALHLGARSDYPVGEHPARQWSSETTNQEMPEMLKCPIHIAIERGHMKIVDLFVRHSLLCTQAIHPISGFLPYRLASSLAKAAKNKSEQQRYKQIYLYLYDKQFNLKIPFKITNDGDCSGSTVTTRTKANSPRQLTVHTHFFSLPRYCKIIRWCDRARERVWKKYCVAIDHSIETKRAYQSKGLLGYRVLIDGFNNTFDPSVVSDLSEASRSQAHTDQMIRNSTYTDEEREKILKTKVSMKQFLASQPRTKTGSNSFGRRSRNPPLLAQHGIMGAKMQTINFTTMNPSIVSENFVSSSGFSQSQDRSSTTDCGHQSSKLNTNITQSVVFDSVSVKPNENQQASKPTTKSIAKLIRKTNVRKQISPSMLIGHQNKENEQPEQRTPLPTPATTSNASTIQSLWKQKVRMVLSANVTSSQPKETSPITKFLSSSTHLTTRNEQQKMAASNDQSKPTEQTLANVVEKFTTKRTSFHTRTDHSSDLNIDSPKAHPDHQAGRNLSPIQMRSSLGIHQATIKSYERHTNASIHNTATECLREASFLKRKSWMKQVEMGKEMVKQRAKRLIERPDQEKRNSVSVPMRTMTGAAPVYPNASPTNKVK